MIRTYTYKLYKNKKVESKFNKWLNGTRYVYNLAKETKEIAYQSGVQLSGYELSKQLTECKKEFDWLKDINAQTLQGVIERLDLSYKNFFKDFKDGKISKLKQDYINKCKKNNVEINQQKLRDIGKPKWAKKKDWKSFGFKQGNLVNSRPSLRFEKDGLFNLPKFGKVKVFNYRHINERDIKTARLIKKADGIYLSIVAEVPDKTYCNNESQVGIDMGIKYFAVTSDGEYVGNPKFLGKQLNKLRIEQRKLSRKKKFSKRWYMQVDVISRLHKKVVDCRKDFLHKQSTYFATNYLDIVIEDLEITKMVKGRFSKHISDVSWGTFFDMLKYKSNNLVRVNSSYTSQECSKCGHTCKENRVTQSIFKCVSCGHEDNADIDAAKVILGRAFPNSRERSTVVQALAVESNVI